MCEAVERYAKKYGQECRQEGKAEGRREGKAEGRLEFLRTLVERKLAQDKTITEIAADLGVTVEEVKSALADSPSEE